MPKMTFIERNGAPREVDAPLGLSVLEIAHRHGVDIEGACEGSLACSTCHVIVESRLVPAARKADRRRGGHAGPGIRAEATSRLGCQIVMTAALDGLVVKLPAATRNAQG